MFEKEAEEHCNEQCSGCGCNNGMPCKAKCHDWQDEYYDWKDGAEFGYNKANEWHKIADGDLPKEPRTVLVFTKEFGVDMDIWTGHTFDQSVTKVIAWKEIVLPEEEQ